MLRSVFVVIVFKLLLARCSGNDPYTPTVIPLKVDLTNSTVVQEPVCWKTNEYGIGDVVLTEGSPFTMQVYSQKTVLFVFRCYIADLQITYQDIISGFLSEMPDFSNYYEAVHGPWIANTTMDGQWTCEIGYSNNGDYTKICDIKFTVRVRNREAFSYVAHPDSRNKPRDQPCGSPGPHNYIQIKTYKQSHQYNHYTDSMLELNKTFTIFMNIDKSISPDEPRLTRLVCYNSDHISEIFVNDPVNNIKTLKATKPPWRFDTNVTVALDTMNREWTCSMKLEKPFITVNATFNVNFCRNNTSRSPGGSAVAAKNPTAGRRHTTSTRPQYEHAAPTPNLPPSTTAIPGLNTIYIEASKKNVFAQLQYDSPALLTLEEPFTIQVKSAEKVDDIQCRYGSNKQFTRSLKYDKENYITEQINISAEMNGTWKCKLFYPEGKQIAFDIPIHIVDKFIDTLTTEQPAPPDMEALPIELNKPILQQQGCNSSMFPYIYISFHKESNALYHSINSTLELGKSFTIVITVPQSMKTIDPNLKQIICYNNIQPKQRLINVLINKRTSASPGGNLNRYDAKVPQADSTMMNVEWQCAIYGSQTYANITLRFPVNFCTPPAGNASSTLTPVITYPSTEHHWSRENERLEDGTSSTDPTATNIADSTSVPTINITIYMDNDKPKAEKLDLTQILDNDKNFNMTIYHPSPDTEIRKVTCVDLKNDAAEFINASDPKSIKYIVKKANMAMECNWMCKILINTGPRGRQPVNITFPVKVRQKGRITVMVNDRKINNTKLMPVTNAEFDEEGTSSYYEGEIARLACQHSEVGVTLMSMELKAYDDKHVQLANVTTEYYTQEMKKPRTIYAKLTTRHDGGYLYCRIKNINIYTVRLTLRQRGYDKDAPKIKVNKSVAMVPTKTTYMKYRFYYEYHDGETLTITDDETRYTTSCKDNRRLARPPAPADLSEKRRKINLNFTDTVYNSNTGFIIECNRVRYHSIMKTENPEAFYNVELVPAPRINLFNIIGLSYSQLLIMFRRSETRYDIVYDNVGNKNLSLTCSMFDTAATCRWNHTDDLTTGDKKTNHSQIISNKQTFVMKKNISQTVIECSCSTVEKTFIYHAIILYHPEENIPPTTTSENPTTASGRATDGETSSNVPGTEAPGDRGTTVASHNDGKWNILIVGGVIVLLIAISLVACMIVTIYKRKRRAEQEASDITYENLPEHNEGAMIMPVQWDNYARVYDEARAAEENPYSEPYVKSSLGTNGKPIPNRKPHTAPPGEGMYAEVNNMEPTYSSVGQGADVEGSNGYANFIKPEQPYAQVLPKHLRKDPRYAQVLPPLDEACYARVLPKSERTDGYANVFDNQRYANATQAENKSEYSEPAYCEVNIKNK